MTLEEQLNQDIKTALLAHDADKVTTLRGLKAVLLNVKVANGTRDTGLSDEEVQTIFAKEAKKRQESAELYVQGNSKERADKELAEKAIIETYLPKQLSEDELAVIIDEIAGSVEVSGMAAMGQVIGQVKARVGNSADGATIARLVKEKLA